MSTRSIRASTLDVASATRVDAAGHVTIATGEAGDTIDAEATDAALPARRPPRLRASTRGPAGRAASGAASRASTSWAAPPRPPSRTIRGGAGSFEVEAAAASLRAVSRLPVRISGSARVRAAGSFRNGALDARVTGSFDDLDATGVSLDCGGFEGRVTGSAGALHVEALAWGSGVRAGLSTWTKVILRARGPLIDPRLDATFAGPRGEIVSGSAALDVDTKALNAVRLRLGGGEVGAEVARIAATPGGVRIDGFRLEGAGVLEGTLVVGGSEVGGELRGTDVDLAKAASLAGVPLRVAGLANVDVQLASGGRGGRRGHVDVEVDGGRLDGIEGLSGLLSVRFDGREVRADGLIRLVSRALPGEMEPCDGAVAQVRLSRGVASLPGALLDAAAWRRVSGTAELAADDWDLRCLRRLSWLAQTAAGSLSDVRGKVTARATVERAPDAPLPSVRGLSVKTRGLALTGVGWRSLHTDVELGGAMDAATGVTEATLSILDDAVLASARLDVTLDLPALLGAPERRWASLRRVPLHGWAQVPRRAVTAFSGLPSFVTERLPWLTGYGDTLVGDVQLDAEVTGTLDAPTFDGHVEAWGLRQATIPEPLPTEDGCTAPPAPRAWVGAWGLLVDADAHVTYDGREARLDGLHLRHDGRVVASASGRLALPIMDVLDGRAHPTVTWRSTSTRCRSARSRYFVAWTSAAISTAG